MRHLILAAVVGLVPPMLAGQRLTAVTLPFPGLSPDDTHWLLFGDTLVSIADTGDDDLTAVVRSFSLTGQTPLWHFDLVSGSQRRPAERRFTTDLAGRRLFVGAGPLHLIDVAAGTVRWSKTCAEVGFVDPHLIARIGSDQISIVGSAECKNIGALGQHTARNTIMKNLQEPRLLLLDALSGRIVWSHPAHSRKFTVNGVKLVDFGYTRLRRDPLGTDSAVDRLVVAGDQLEVLRLSDGTSLWQSPPGAGESPGVAGDRAFIMDKKDLVAYDVANGAVVWRLPLDAESAALYSAAALQEAGDSSRLDPADVIVSTYKTVTRVILRNGEARWSIPRQNAWWQFTRTWLYVQFDDSTVAYDYDSGKPEWTLRGGKRLRVEAAVPTGSDTVLLFVDRGKMRDADHPHYAGPFRFWGVSLRTGHVVWQRDKVAAKKIVDYDLVYEGQVRLIGDKVTKYENVSISDGSEATPPAEAADEHYVSYSQNDEVLRCQTYGGDVLWQRAGAQASNARFAVRRTLGYVLWPTATNVEAIALSDGVSLWKTETPVEPLIRVTESGAAFAVLLPINVILVKVEPGH